jgi:hypothetical protein
MPAPKKITEGYIKFRCEWKPARPVPEADIRAINQWRDTLYALGLIGIYPTGIGFGNVSARKTGQKSFLISGTATGGIKKLDKRHYTRVTAYDFDKNALSCIGPIRASSESLSHAALYCAVPQVRAVMHIHSKKLWRRWIDKLPTTSRKAEYGTPEMAREIMRLLRKKETCRLGIIVMGGHAEGLIAFGRNPDEAGGRLLMHVGLLSKVTHP